MTQTFPFVDPRDPTCRKPSALFRPIPFFPNASAPADEDVSREDDSDTHDWSPRADLIETESSYHIDLDLPGVDQRQLQITLGDGVLTIAGERSLHESHGDGRFHILERQGRQFSRSFWLGLEVEIETVDATFGNGVLHVSIRKAHTSTLRRIEVRIES